MAFEQAVDEMQAAGTTGAGAGCQFAGQQRLRPGRKAACLLVPDMHPVNVAPPDGIRHVVKRVSWNAIAAANACLFECLDDDVGNGG